MQPPSSVWWNLLVHCPSLAALIVRCQLWQVGRLQVAISHSVPCTSKIKCLWLSAAPECNWCRKLGSMKEPIHTAHHSPTTWSSVAIDACLYGVCLSSVSGRATSVYLCHYLDCTVCMCYVQCVCVGRWPCLMCRYSREPCGEGSQPCCGDHEWWGTSTADRAGWVHRKSCSTPPEGGEVRWMVHNSCIFTFFSIQ